MISALEELLQLPPGWLTVRIPPGGSKPPAHYAVVDYAVTLSGLFDRLRRDAHGQLRNLTMLDEIHLGADRSVQQRRVTQRVVAVQPVDRIIIAAQGETGCDVEPLALRAVSGCRTAARA